ncbi:MAG: hypothetical protein J7K77_01870, partial [Dehalococcoidales bacterium]|nr:hypothetical protein [Dehalococcoidales bacterium]
MNKKKFSKILGVAVTAVVTMSMVFAAIPVQAAEEAWSLYTLPATGAAGDYFMDNNIAGLGPVAKAIDDTLYMYVAGVGYNDLFKSTDGGRTWEDTDWALDADVTPAAIVDIACSPTDADTLYVATAANVYKTDDAAGDWTELGPGIAVGAGCIQDGGTGSGNIGDVVASHPITSIAVGVSGGVNYVYAAVTTAGAYDGEVWYIKDAPWARIWTDLDIASGPVHGANTSFDVLTVNCSPFFNDDTQVDVVVTDNNPYTAVLDNLGGTRTWSLVAELKTGDVAAFEATKSSDIQYVDDFDEQYEMFVGVNNVTVAGAGDVFRVCGVACV